jgi:hypothetical protein
VIGFRGLTVSDEDRFAMEVISQLLAGQGGRLFVELRDRRSLAYSVNAVHVEGVAPGFFAVYIATAPEKFDEAKHGLLQQLTGLLDAPPDEAELDRVRRYLIGSFAIEQQRNAVHAAQLALDALYGLRPGAARLPRVPRANRRGLEGGPRARGAPGDRPRRLHPGERAAQRGRLLEVQFPEAGKLNL